MSNITLKQNSIIEYSELDRIALEVDKRLSVYKFDSLIVNEENYKDIKKLRAELNNEFKEFETVRKDIKKRVLSPYEAFEKEFKEKIASKYEFAEINLKKAINDVENGLKEIRINELKEYFEELKLVKDLDFVQFEQANLSVGLSDSMKSLKDNLKTFLDNVDKDIATIKTLPNRERVLVRYQNSLDLAQSITSVNQEVEQENAIKNLGAVKIEEEVQPIVITEPQPLIEVTFKVMGTREQLVDLRNYMKGKGISYE